MNKLLKDAIADAKTVRDSAIANAKVALEEAFSPKLQSMLSHKIKEELDSVEGEEDEDPEVTNMKELAGIESQDSEEMSDEDEMPSEDEMPADDSEEMSDEDEMPADDSEEMSDDSDEVSDDDIEEILRELESEDEHDVEQPHSDDRKWGEKNMAGKKDDVEESEDPEQKDMMDGMDEEINLDELISSLREADESEEEPKVKKDEDEEMSKTEGKNKKMKQMEQDLNEAYSAVKFLRSKLSEVNLLNAKLLFVNKIFRKQNLSEAQKLKVIGTLDRANNVREAKLIYTTIAESLSVPKPKTATKLTEGFASKPQPATKIVADSNGLYQRFSDLINYNPNN